jgi:hypothetical protein
VLAWNRAPSKAGALSQSPTSTPAGPGRATIAFSLAAAPDSLCLCHGGSRESALLRQGWSSRGKVPLPHPGGAVVQRRCCSRGIGIAGTTTPLWRTRSCQGTAESVWSGRWFPTPEAAVRCAYGSTSAAGDVGVTRTGSRIAQVMQPSAARGETGGPRPMRQRGSESSAVPLSDPLPEAVRGRYQRRRLQSRPGSVAAKHQVRPAMAGGVSSLHMARSACGDRGSATG